MDRVTFSCMFYGSVASLNIITLDVGFFSMALKHEGAYSKCCGKTLRVPTTFTLFYSTYDILSVQKRVQWAVK